MLQSAELAEAVFEKKRKRPAPPGPKTYDPDAMLRAYERRSENVTMTAEEYARLKATMPEFYRASDSMLHGVRGPPAAPSVHHSRRGSRCMHGRAVGALPLLHAGHVPHPPARAGSCSNSRARLCGGQGHTRASCGGLRPVRMHGWRRGDGVCRGIAAMPHSSAQTLMIGAQHLPPCRWRRT